MVSLLMLFLELFLIRWVSTEIRIFAYISNLVLLACFIGIGIGCYFSHKRHTILWSFAFLGILILATRSVLFKKITDFLGGFSDYAIWQIFDSVSFASVSYGISLTIFLFIVIILIFIPLGQILGNILDNHQNPILAYSLNIVGSIIGIWFFSVLSHLFTPPWALFVLSTLMGTCFLKKRSADVSIFLGIAAFSFLFIFAPLSKSIIKTYWSPYQKLEVFENTVRPLNIKNGYGVIVNNAGYMGLFDMSEKFISQNSSRIPENFRAFYKYNQYELPYFFHDNEKEILIIGAGGGNDVAGALRQGIPSIDAVEIDPAIYKIGALFHPEKPYDNSRVHITINDARSYFKQTKKHYDLISFGLLDSHTLGSSYNNIRLDNYIYTLESFKETKSLLKKNGVLSILFMPEKEWIAERIYSMLKEVFQAESLVLKIPNTYGLFGYGGVMFLISNNKDNFIAVFKKYDVLKSFIIKPNTNTTIKNSTDDWPYLYLEKPSIPKIHLLIILSLLILFLFVRKVLSPKFTTSNLHFFFLGAAFLLLEFQNISKASLLFGSTWLVNAYIISAILTLALAANLIIYKYTPQNINWAYYFLFAVIIILYLLPLHVFNNFGHVVKATIITIFLNIPIFFAGLIFIYSFNKTEQKDTAFGSNLLGAAVGGIIESLSFLTGLKSLLLVVLLLYLLSYVFFKDKQLIKIKI